MPERVVAKQLTVSRTQLPPTMRAIDLFLKGLLLLAPSQGLLEADSLMAAARKKEKLDDFGGDVFDEPMRAALASANSTDICSLGRVTMRNLGIKSLVNRLRITDYIRRHPAVADIPIQRPVFILGFPRTGTTVLQNLLTLDPGYRALEFWELSSPTPVDDDRERDRAKRIKAIDRTLRAAYLLAPEMAEVHEIRASTPEECWPLFANAFSALAFDLGNGLTTFGDWLMTHDMVAAYREYRQQLQLLSHRREPASFVLKCPEHLWFLDALLTVFPDAAIVWTHRDPAASIASYCSLVSMGRRTMHGQVDPHELGAQIQRRFLQGVNRAMAARDAADPKHFMDVSFEDLVSDPAAMVRRIKERFDIPHPEGAEDRIVAWQNSGRKDKKGKHKYDAAFYGIDRAAVHADYAHYIERFEIPIRS